MGYNHLIVSTDQPKFDFAPFVWLSPIDHPPLEKALGELKTGAIWVRPDRYIGAISDSSEGLVNTLSKFFETKDQKKYETSLP